MTGLQIFDEYGAPLVGGTVHLFEQSQWNTRVMAVSYATFLCEDAPGCVNPKVIDAFTNPLTKNSFVCGPKFVSTLHALCALIPSGCL